MNERNPMSDGRVIALAKVALKSDVDASAAIEAKEAAEAAQEAAEDAVEQISELIADKANVDGSYPDMTVGNAEQLVSEDYLTDAAPYVFRTAGGNVDIGDREYDELVGGTIAWNQHAQYGDTSTTYFTTLTLTRSASTHSFSVSGTPTLTASVADFRVYVGDETPIPVGHKIVAIFSNASSMKWRIQGEFTYKIGSGIVSITGQDAIYDLVFQVEKDVQYDFTTCYYVCDLTQMFGTAIADYIYSLEQANAGAGVAWFRSYFPKDYYAYDAGSLQSVQAASHDMVGFNQWDEEWANGYYDASGAYVSSNNYLCSKNKIAIFADQQYYLKFPVAMTIRLYDADKAFLGSAPGTWMNETFNASTYNANAAYITFHNAASGSYTTYHNDICINLSWSGYRNGEYEAYEKNSYPLDSTLTLRGIPKLDASNNLYYDGDTYEADGTVTRKYGFVDGATEASGNDKVGLYWNNQKATQLDTNKRITFSLGYSATAYKNWGNLTGMNTKGLTGSAAVTSGGGTTRGYWQASNRIYICLDLSELGMSSYTSANTDLEILSALKTALTTYGLQFVFELATPTTETADAFQSPQIVNDFGTEQYVDAAVAAGTRDVAIPVGHDTRYMSNLKDKLRRLPNIPDNAGTYLVYYDGTTRRMSCTEYLDGAKVTALEGKVPDAPAEDGTYTLTATVADGEVTYSWVSA